MFLGIISFLKWGGGGRLPFLFLSLCPHALQRIYTAARVYKYRLKVYKPKEAVNRPKLTLPKTIASKNVEIKQIFNKVSGMWR